MVFGFSTAGIEGYGGGLFWANGGIIVNSYGNNHQMLRLLYFNSMRVRILDMSIFVDSEGVQEVARTNLIHLHKSFSSLSNGHIVSICNTIMPTLSESTISSSKDAPWLFATVTATLFSVAFNTELEMRFMRCALKSHPI